MELVDRGVLCSLPGRTVSFDQRRRVGSLRARPQFGVITQEGSSSSPACCLFSAHSQTGE